MVDWHAVQAIMQTIMELIKPLVAKEHFAYLAEDLSCGAFEWMLEDICQVLVENKVTIPFELYVEIIEAQNQLNLPYVGRWISELAKQTIPNTKQD